MGGPSNAQKQLEQQQQQQLQQLDQEKAENLKKLQDRQLAAIRRLAVGGGAGQIAPGATAASLLPASPPQTTAKIGGN